MESSIAVFLWRQPARERLPTLNGKPHARECVVIIDVERFGAAGRAAANAKANTAREQERPPSI